MQREMRKNIEVIRGVEKNRELHGEKTRIQVKWSRIGRINMFRK